jgi:ABC-2 type transport system ATP-binding protein
VANFRELLRTLASRHTILVSTHILGEVEACCSRVVVVHRGRTVADEPVSVLRQRAASATRLRLRVRSESCAPLASALAATGWARIVESGGGDTLVCEAASGRRGELVALAEAHGGLRELVEERRSLEEVFRDLVGGNPPAASIDGAAPAGAGTAG